MATFTAAPAETSTLPDITISVRQVFGLDSEMQVPGFSQKSEHVPDVDESYRFDHDTTMAILARRDADLARRIELGRSLAQRVIDRDRHGAGSIVRAWIEPLPGTAALAAELLESSGR